MNSSAVLEFLQSFSGPDFPFGNRFEALECLGETHFAETYLLSEKNTGTLYVLKIQRDLESAAGNEADLLRGLNHAGIPGLCEIFEQDGTRHILRKYIEGEPLDKYIELSAASPVDYALIANVMLNLCDILEYLHSRPEPIIHRDIKPSNIIFNPKNGAVSLIDFGISRKYSDEAETDTVYFGTQKYAPPEQYGFAQTDARSDIYSLGVVLRYWLTGSTDRKAEIKNRRLAKIAEKCTAFEPEARYQTAAAVKKALSKYKHRVRRRITAGIAAAFVFCMVFAAGITTYNYIATEAPPAEAPPVSAPPSLPFEISQEEFREFAERGASAFLSRSGFPKYTFIEGEGLLISGRNRNSYAVDFDISAFPPGEYILAVEFVSDDASAFFEAALAGLPYGAFAYAEGNTLIYNLLIEDVDGRSKAYLANFQSGEQSWQNRIRLQTNWRRPNDPHPDFIIRSITVDTP